MLNPREPTAEERERIDDVLLAALLARPYYADGIRALKPYMVDDGKLATTVAVGSNGALYCGAQWLVSFSVPALGFMVAAHEMEHIRRRHGARRGGRDPEAFNDCADAEINDDDPRILELFPHGVSPAKLGQPDGLTAEEYYERLCCESHSMDGVCGGGSGAGRPLEGEIGGGMSPADTEAMIKRMAHAVAKYMATHGRGSVPAGVAMWADSEAAHVRPSWPRELTHAVSSAPLGTLRGREDYGSRISRRTRDDSPVRRATVRHPPRVAAVVDTSGSMAEDGPVVLGTLRALRQTSGAVTVIACDAAVHDSRDGVLRGGGGTNMIPAIELAARKHDVIVVITDTETPWPEKAPRVPVVVVSTRLGASAPPWARYVDAS
jgi:predicted metal-dependent peptidase